MTMRMCTCIRAQVNGLRIADIAALFSDIRRPIVLRVQDAAPQKRAPSGRRRSSSDAAASSGAGLDSLPEHSSLGRPAASSESPPGLPRAPPMAPSIDLALTDGEEG